MISAENPQAEIIFPELRTESLTDVDIDASLAKEL